jgi:hypothetical protein
MTTYLTAEAAVLTLLRAYNAGATFTVANSVVDDWTIIDTAPTSAFVEMGDDTIEAVEINDYGAHDEYQEQHTISLWICQKRSTGAAGDAALKQGLKTLTEAVKDYLRPYRRLNNATGVRSMQISSTTPPLMIRRTATGTNGPGLADASHFAQRIQLTVLCESDAPDGEIDG